MGKFKGSEGRTWEEDVEKEVRHTVRQQPGGLFGAQMAALGHEMLKEAAMHLRSLDDQVNAAMARFHESVTECKEAYEVFLFCVSRLNILTGGHLEVFLESMGIVLDDQQKRILCISQGLEAIDPTGPIPRDGWITQRLVQWRVLASQVHRQRQATYEARVSAAINGLMDAWAYYREQRQGLVVAHTDTKNIIERCNYDRGVALECRSASLGSAHGLMTGGGVGLFHDLHRARFSNYSVPPFPPDLPILSPLSASSTHLSAATVSDIFEEMYSVIDRVNRQLP